MHSEPRSSLSSATHIVRRRHRREARRRRRETQRRAWTGLTVAVFLLVLLLPGGAAVGGTALVYWQAVAGLPSPQETVALDPLVGPTRLYDQTGQTLLLSVQDPLGDSRRWIALDELPSYVMDATLTWEDADFLTHPPVDPMVSISRLWTSIAQGQVEPDGSITARLVRNALLDSQADPTREVALIAEINRLYSPQAVLEWHLNTNYYGNDAYGIDAAAQVYLNKPATSLTLDEAALLAAIPLAPQYNPLDNETAARGRQQDVLRAMRRAGQIAEADFESAIATQTAIQRGAVYPAEVAPDFALYARDQAEEILDTLGYDGARLVARGGLKVTTTLDLDLYYQAECTLRAHLARLRGEASAVQTLTDEPCASAVHLPAVAPTDAPPTEGSITMIDVDTGAIRAMVGAATDANNQPGPVLQPFVYINAFRSPTGITPASMVLDIPRAFPGAQAGLIYEPANPDAHYRGPMNLRDAMGAGLLPPAVDVAHRQGIDNILRDAHQIGLNTLDLGVYDLTLLERGGQASPLDVAYAYSVFASLGNMRGVSVEPVGNGYRGRDPVAVLKIEDADGNVLWEYTPESVALNTTSVLDTPLAYLLTDVLADQETRWPVLGNNSVLDLTRPAAVVNGLTADRADDWTVGYTPHLVTAVHLERSTGGTAEPMALDPFGMDGAAALWRAMMDYAGSRDRSGADRWPRPDRIIELPVCERSGTLPNGNCPVRQEIFIDGMVRLINDTYWQSFEVNRRTGQLATANTPNDQRADRVFFVPPPEAFDWWTENDLPLPPTEVDTVSRPELFGSAAILQPESFAYVGGVVDVRGSLTAENLQFYQLAYGQGLNPSSWVDIGGPQTEFTPGGSLGTWDTTGLDGLYNLRLTVVTNDQAIETTIVPMTVDNRAPTLALNAGEPGQIYRWPGDTTLTLTADAADNLAIDRVEFYRGGEFLGSDSEWPYSFDWTLEGTGTERFTATAFDAAGNSATSAELSVDIVRAS